MNGVAGPISGPHAAPVRPARRVRHEVRDGLALMAFSAATSVALAGALTLLTGLGK
ncbi:hypothetical protein ACVW00_002487 [Marmoricola sp. URHA0025 HA25]